MDIREHIISILVNNQPGVLSRVAGVFSGRGYNIASLCVAETTNPEVSRITLTSRADTDFTEKIKKYLDRLVDVIAVEDFTGTDCVQRELMLIGVTLPQEHRPEILRAVELFGCRIVALATEYVILEVTGDAAFTSSVLKFFSPYGVEEMNRTGTVAVLQRKDIR
jgi:acetolactate synthase-1/3 small subunit